MLHAETLLSMRKKKSELKDLIEKKNVGKVFATATKLMEEYYSVSFKQEALVCRAWHRTGYIHSYIRSLPRSFSFRLL